jgi:CheY-like chemotaxis protein
MSLHGLLAGQPCDSSLMGRRVLVVEDDYVVAQDLLEELLRWGAEVMGPAACVAEALNLLQSSLAPDMAILDIGLGDETVYPVSEALRARGIPFVFATVYDAWVIPAAYADVPRAEKPLALMGEPLVSRR